MARSASEEAVGGEVMAAVDVRGGAPWLVIADISTDGSWLAVPQDEAPSVLEWR